MNSKIKKNYIRFFFFFFFFFCILKITFLQNEKEPKES
jgi:ABC-type long-subunit fatty acid transport system fused permease/ATPase subunit